MGTLLLLILKEDHASLSMTIPSGDAPRYPHLSIKIPAFVTFMLLLRVFLYALTASVSCSLPHCRAETEGLTEA